MICYLDSSALTKKYVVEPGFQEVEQLIAAAEVTGTAWITLVEVVANAREARADDPPIAADDSPKPAPDGKPQI